MNSILKNINKILKYKETNILVVIIILIILITIRNNNFIRPSNLVDIMNDSSILLIMAIGQFLVILTGGIDLSIASGIGLTGMSVAMLNQYFPGIPIYIIILISLVLGFFLGVINASLITFGKIPPIITTLGTMSIYRGFIYVLTKGEWVDANEMSAIFKNFVHLKFFGISTMIIFALSIFIIFYIFSKYSKTGREIYGVGGNELASNYAGINTNKIKFFVYSMNGILIGLAGYLWVAHYASAQSETAFGFELQPIACCVIGGVSIAGGSGNIIGVLFGTAFMGIINNALTQVNISPFWQMAIQGFIILFAIVINTVIENKNQDRVMKRRII